ncbi:MAG: FHA domain-containing protein [Candidatus Promineifilaceae bacterium]|nr:FHA domain-containing protein [Candidatus Promineifilaceae bacterium]
MNEVPARLVVKLGPNPDKEYTLTQPEITIGRSSGNTIVIPNPEVSRRHARIRLDANGIFYIEDWGSTNGTFVSGQRVMNPTILHHEDTIRLGDSIILLFYREIENNTTFVSEAGPGQQDTIVDTTPQRLRKDVAQVEHAQVPQESFPVAQNDDFILPAEDNTNRNRLRLLGCSCSVLLLPLLCIAVLIFLDFYQQGRLLYCGPIRPFFEIILGPIGFAPICP